MSRHYHGLPHQLSLTRWSFTKKGWHPQHKRLARLRCLYWTVIRYHETEICAICGGPVRLVFHVPDEIWAKVTGYGARHPSGEAAPGILCPPCVDDLYEKATPRGAAGFLRWTCATDDSVMEG